MNNREYTKKLIKERMFQIYEAFECVDYNKILTIQGEIYREIRGMMYEGHKIPMKNFILEVLNKKFHIKYEWSTILRKTERVRIGRDNHGWMRKIPTNKFYNKKFTVLGKITINEIK